jgi:hypothetical protein
MKTSVKTRRIIIAPRICSTQPKTEMLFIALREPRLRNSKRGNPPNCNAQCSAETADATSSQRNSFRGNSKPLIAASGAKSEILSRVDARANPAVELIPIAIREVRVKTNDAAGAL